MANNGYHGIPPERYINRGHAGLVAGNRTPGTMTPGTMTPGRRTPISYTTNKKYYDIMV